MYSLDNRELLTGDSFEFVIPNDLFEDVDKQGIAVNVLQQGLPEWLNYDIESKLFSYQRFLNP